MLNSRKEKISFFIFMYNAVEYWGRRMFDVLERVFVDRKMPRAVNNNSRCKGSGSFTRCARFELGADSLQPWSPLAGLALLLLRLQSFWNQFICLNNLFEIIKYIHSTFHDFQISHSIDQSNRFSSSFAYRIKWHYIHFHNQVLFLFHGKSISCLTTKSIWHLSIPE